LEIIDVLLSSLFFICITFSSPAGWMPAVRQTPGVEATAQSQCSTLTELKVGRTSYKLSHTSRGETNGYSSKNSMKECSLQE